MERLGINSKNFVFEKFDELFEFWSESIRLQNELLDLTCESVLLYTLSKMGNRFLCSEKDVDNSASASNCLLIKQYIDDNFNDPALSCEKISARFSYSKKYVSRIFNKHFQIGITEYINTVRINHACRLIEQSNVSISDISLRVGFTDPLYFSKVFKQRVGVSPKKYITQKNSKK